MTDEEKKALIQRYIAAYNTFDVAEMVALVHRDIIFRNVARWSERPADIGVP